jgi:tetratricopeptide (TPR) repeat protein
MRRATRIAMLIGALIALPSVVPAARAVAEPDLEAVVALLEGGQLQAAEAELRRLLAVADGAELRDLLGVTLFRLGRSEEAEQQFRQAVALAPDLLPPRQHLARSLLQNSRSAEALSELRAAARLGALERPLALWLADAEAAQGNTPGAVAQLESVIERFDSVQALLLLARIESREGRHQAAFEALQRALEIAPNSEAALAARAKIALAAGTPAVAIFALEPLTRIFPEVSEYTYLLGVARMQIADMTGAIEALERAVELQPGKPLPLLALGRALLVQKSFAQAKDTVRRCLRLDPGNAEALAVLAEAEQALGEVELAEQHAVQALARDGDHPRALMTLGLIRMSEARHEEARDILLQVVASEPELAKAHYQLSLALARLGDRESSARHLEVYRRLRREQDQGITELRKKAGLEAPETEGL